MAEALATVEPAGTDLTEVIDTARRLAAVMAAEIQLLRQLQVREIERLTEEKHCLAAAWQRQVEALRRNPAFNEGLEPRLGAELRRVVEELERTARANETAMLAAMEANQRLFNAITQAARDREDRGRTYTPPGASQPGPRNLSVGIDHRL